MNGKQTPRLAVGRQEAEEDGYDTFTKRAVECVFDQIGSFGLYVIRYVMFLCFQVHFRTKQTKCVLAYVMLNIICFLCFFCFWECSTFFSPQKLITSTLQIAFAGDYLRPYD